MKRNKDLDELGISRRAYLATFVKERKLLRFIQRRLYGFDYREMRLRAFTEQEKKKLVEEYTQVRKECE